MIIIKTQLFASALLSISLVTPLFAASIDWAKVSRLQDKVFLSYVESLNLKGQAALDFWKRIPLSRANKPINDLFRKDAFAIYMKKYPRASNRGEAFKVGMGTKVIGPISGQPLKLPFTSYQPLPEGPIGDPDKTYRIGYTIHGLAHPWNLNNADAAAWEAQRHPNVELTLLDPQFDNDKQIAQIDNWLADNMDGILIWPMQEAYMGAPVDRAYKAGITTVTVDRMVGSRKVSAQVTGNFPANGAQQGVYLVHRLMQELGEVKVDLLIRNDHVSLSFNMENSKIKQLLESSLDQFQENLEQKGFVLDECMISSGGNEENEDAWQRFESAWKSRAEIRVESLDDLTDNVLYHTANNYDAGDGGISLFV